MENTTLGALVPLAALIAASFVSGGVTIAGLLVLVAKYAMSSPVLMSAIEQLARGLHPDTLKAINLVAQVAEEVTDGTPYAEKPTPPASKE